MLLSQLFFIFYGKSKMLEKEADTNFLLWDQ